MHRAEQSAEADGGPIDFAHLAEQTAGDSALQAELLAIFARQAREILERVATRAGNAERQERTVLLHTLSGSARAVGAWRVAADAQRLEAEARAGAAPGDLDPLQDSVSEACAAITAR